MTTAEDELPLPPKDEFEDGSDAELLANDKDPSVNNPQQETAAAEAQSKELYKGRTVSWKYVWVKTPGIFPGLPPVFTKKWVRTITEPPSAAQPDPQVNSAQSERSDESDNRLGQSGTQQKHAGLSNGARNSHKQ